MATHTIRVKPINASTFIGGSFAITVQKNSLGIKQNTRWLALNNVKLHRTVLAAALLLANATGSAMMLEGFESPALPPGGAALKPGSTVWEFSGSVGAGIQRNGRIPNAPSAPDGRQTAYLKGSDARIASKITLDKGDYTVSFYVAKGSQDAGNPVQARIDGKPVGLAVTSTNGGFWRYTTPTFSIAATGTYTLDIVSSPTALASSMALVDAVSVSRVGVTEPVVVKVMPDDAEGTIRSDIGAWTFGSGIESIRAEIRMAMGTYNGEYPQSPVGRQATARALMDLKLGSLRFPNGDSSMGYTWSYPDGSFQSTNNGNYTTQQLTPDEIIKYTQACWPGSSPCKPQLNMQRLFQVNTVFRRDFNNGWSLNYLDAHFHTNPRQPPLLNTQNRDSAARYAGAWVAADAANPLGRTTFWEIGNEDWSRWKPQDYASIFAAFQREMRSKRGDIRLLAQGLGSEHTTWFGTNRPSEWLNALTADPAVVDGVYAYSIHKYLKAGIYPGSVSPEERRVKQTQEMLGLVATGEPVKSVKGLLADSPAAAWKVWMTEFNLAQDDDKGNAATLQDMGHGLVIADWTGKMLEQNVERMFMHSLDHKVEFALLAYANLPGTSLETPRVTVPGYAYARYAQEFGKTLLRNTAANNPEIIFTDEQNRRLSYPQVGVYASLAQDRQSLRLMVLNRHMSLPADVAIAALPVPGFKLAGGQYKMSTLQATGLSVSNQNKQDEVKWSNWTWRPQSESTGISPVKLAPASVNLFVIPVVALKQ